MDQIMQIEGQPLQVQEIKGQRVVTLSQIAWLHKTSESNLRQNFRRNRRQFIKGEDYYLVFGTMRSDKLSLSHNQDVNFSGRQLYLTESGYLMLIKSLRDDLAWKVQRALVNSYFRKDIMKSIYTLLPESYKKVIYYRKLGLTQKETGKILDLHKDSVREIENKLKELGYIQPVVDRARFQLNGPEPKQIEVDNEQD